MGRLRFTVIISLIFLLVSCEEDPAINGTWSFATEQFSGTININSEGIGTGTFSINGKSYVSINSEVFKGSSIILYSEDGAYMGLHQLDFPISKYQEYREGGLPSPIKNQSRTAELRLVRK